jgi:uncharacterized protein involved in type VI secretion and phage assembly
MSHISGVVVGLVTSVKDPENLGRIKVNFPWLDKTHETDWVRIASLMAGNGRGAFFMPEVKDEVLLAFRHGDPRFPYVVGFLWNGKDKPPAKNVRDRILKSKNGHQLRFLDSTPSGGSLGALIIEDAHGNRITMSKGKIVIRAKAVLQLDAPTIVLQGRGYRRLVAPNNNGI